MGIKAHKGENDLATVVPRLVAEWDFEKNAPLTPSEVTSMSQRKVWWLCEKKHSWQAVISSRTLGQGCPYCAGRYAISGENDLQTVNPALASEWDYELNGNLLPSSITPASNRKVWWKCSQGHQYQATIGNRTSQHLGCPYCGNQKLLPGFNDLATRNPELVFEWDYEKNDFLKPEEVMYGSKKKVWWKCSKCGNSWNTQVALRAKGSMCPCCSKRKSDI